MKGEELKLGDYCITKSSFKVYPSNHQRPWYGVPVNTFVDAKHNRIKIPKNSILKCVEKPREIDGYYHSILALIEDDKETDIRIYTETHRGLKPLGNSTFSTPGKTSRKLERTRLEKQLNVHKRELKTFQVKQDALQEVIKKIEVRLHNLKTYESDEEALADVITTAGAQKLDKTKLADLIKSAGIRL